MNAREKEQYLREYSILKGQGKPFFPYAVAQGRRDGAASCSAVIILMAMLLGAELGPKADPTTTTYTPRPEWYFFFLFELLRVVKPPALVFIATIGIPTICLVAAAPAAVLRPQPRAAPARAPGRDAGRRRDGRRDGLPHRARRARRAAERDRPQGGAPVRAGQGRDGLLRLPRLPQDRRERQHARARTSPRSATGSARTRSRGRCVNPTSPMPSYATLQQQKPEQFDELVDFVASR